MTLTKEELKKEEEYLSNVQDILKEKIKQAGNITSKRASKINEIKRDMWENFTDYSEGEIKEARDNVDQDVDITNEMLIKVFQYKKAYNSPYFGKVSFKAEDQEKLDAYVGITSVEKDYENYVYDWRAPIASLFYDSEANQYFSPSGFIKGQVLDKMQFKIEDGDLKRCFRSNVNINDDFLQDILANSASTHMKSIVSSIQQDQNEIIRNSKDKYLIVQGAAGSGKTSVALHRIAYLLYKDINLKSKNVLIFSPNDIFSDYISETLPELGEETVVTTTFSSFARGILKEFEKIESYSEYLKRCYEHKTKDELIKYKMSDQFVSDIKNFFDDYQNKIVFKKGVAYKKRHVSKYEIRDLFVRKYKDFSQEEKINHVTDYICLRLEVSKGHFENRVKEHLVKFSNIETDYIKMYKMFLNTKYPNVKHKIGENINYEDIAGLLYSKLRFFEEPNLNNIKQVVIDEVQDYNLLKLGLIKKLFKSASFTLLGDYNQTINPFYKYNSLKEIQRIFKNSSYFELKKTYRSSEEIIEYSNQILNLNDVKSLKLCHNYPVDKHNVSIRDFQKRFASDYSSLKELGFKKTAIITKSEESALEVFNVLKDDYDIKLLKSNDKKLKGELFVIPSYLSKGLEFDSVISYSDKKHFYHSHEKELYYVVSTRPQHKLVIYNEPDFS